MTSPLNEAFMKLSKRAETNDRSKLVATFVDVGPLFTLLSNPDHQILYGRRGTGKTHAFAYLAENKRNEGHIAIYIDMRTIGSTGGLYSDNEYSVQQRATRLLLDSFEAIHNGLYEHFVALDEVFDLSTTGPLLDRLAEAITEVKVTGNIEQEIATAQSRDQSIASTAEFTINHQGVDIKIGENNEQKSQQQIERRIKEVGVIQQRVQFGPLGKILGEISKVVGPKRIWILLDEWSSVPIELQPYLADLLRRSVFPATSFTVKIAAIEQRSQFRISARDMDYLGFELGADIAADLDLDDFMVFDNNAERAISFFQELLYRHVNETDSLTLQTTLNSADDIIRQGFTQRNAFEEFVRATEGVPRDAINIMALAAQRAVDDKISIAHIRTAARNWYQRDKETAARTRTEAHELLHWIIDEVIGTRKARAFLLQNDSIPSLIDVLFDARVVHVLKKNISARDQPGVRYDAYKLDYGCYVELIATSRTPVGLFLGEQQNGTDTYIEVPPDDYRAIRRAVLNIDDFRDRNKNAQLPLGL